MDLSNQKFIHVSTVQGIIFHFCKYVLFEMQGHGPWIFVNKWTWSGPWSMDFCEYKTKVRTMVLGFS